MIFEPFTYFRHTSSSVNTVRDGGKIQPVNCGNRKITRPPLSRKITHPPISSKGYTPPISHKDYTSSTLEQRLHVHRSRAKVLRPPLSSKDYTSTTRTLEHCNMSHVLPCAEPCLGVTYPCDYCYKSFRYPDSLWLRVNTFHSGPCCCI